MEADVEIKYDALPKSLRHLLCAGFKFLPHDALKSRPDERVYWLTTEDAVWWWIKARPITAWFHLVKGSWVYREFTTRVVENKFQGPMELVDQRTWGPYVDLTLRSRNERCRVSVALYPRFWSWEVENDIRTSEEAKSGYKEVLRTFRHAARNEGK